jgi:hypothetical protein
LSYIAHLPDVNGHEDGGEDGSAGIAASACTDD